jgi:hypoxanthine-guanine phosphoribosyltransferase/DNA-binding Lrp family transcriptional regulator
MNYMKTNTSQKIIEYIREKGQVSPNELTKYLNITSRAVFKQLKKLLDRGDLSKVGQPPKVYYVIKDSSPNSAASWDKLSSKTIDDNFITVTSSGEFLEGVEAFVHWCSVRNFSPEKKAKEYEKIFNKYESIRKMNLISGVQKLKTTFSEVYLDELYYLDFYSIEVFGKTKLGQKLLYAKQSQNKELIGSLVEDIRPQIKTLIDRKSIDGVLFVPPTVKREIQFMRELEKRLRLKERSLNVTKIRTPIMIPQKTLSKLEERIENARNTFVIDDNLEYNNVLIIDDAVGSGATMNELAKMLQKKGIVKGKIIGLAITGSLKGFDVISEI